MILVIFLFLFVTYLGLTEILSERFWRNSPWLAGVYYANVTLSLRSWIRFKVSSVAVAFQVGFITWKSSVRKDKSGL